MSSSQNETKDSLAMHVAGATVSHEGRFFNLEILENSEPLDKDFIAKYVIPFYMKKMDTTEFREQFLAINDTVNNEVVAKLLGDFNWRTRSVGAKFSALGDMIEYEDNIGKLLLRSDVCYAGHYYCLALASFSSTVAINYLQRYLEYYLRQPNLWFDQSSAMAALSYISTDKSENLIAPYIKLWDEFIIDKPNWNLATSIESFNQQMLSLNEIKREISSFHLKE